MVTANSLHRSKFTTRAPDEQLRWWGAWLLGLVLFLPLSLLHAYNDNFRADEIFTWQMVHYPFQEMMARIANDVHPPLYYLLLRLWLKASNQPWMMQAFSMIWSVCALGTACFVSEQTAGRRAAFWTALALGTCFGFIHFSQDARMYPQALALELLTVAAWARSLNHPRSGWPLLGLGLLAAVYTHNFCVISGGLIFSAAAAQLLLRVRAGQTELRKHLVPAVICVLIVLVGYMPWLPTAWQQRQDGSLRTFQVLPLRHHLYNWFEFTFPVPFEHVPSFVGWLPGVFWLAVLPLMSMRFRSKTDVEAAKNRLPAGWPVWVGLFPLIVMLCVVFSNHPLFDFARHGMLFIPITLIAAAMTLTRLESRYAWGRMLGFAGVLAAGSGAAGLAGHYHDGTPWPVVDRIQQSAGARTSLIYSYGSPELSFGFPMRYATPGDPDVILVLYPGTARERANKLDRFRELMAALPSQNRRVIYDEYYTKIVQVRDAPATVTQALLALELPDPLPSHLGTLVLDDVIDGPTAARRFSIPQWKSCDVSLYFKYAVAARIENGPIQIPVPARSIGDNTAEALLLGIGLDGPAFPLDVSFGRVSGPVDVIRCDVSRKILSCWLKADPEKLLFNGPDMRPLANEFNRASLPPGTYLLWSAHARWIPPATGPIRIALGAPEDELFIRDGFYEREGTPPQTCRWTTQRFGFEFPLSRRRTINVVRLSGMLPAAIRNRNVRVSLSSDPSTTASASVSIDSAQFQQHEFKLDRPIAGDLMRLRFDLAETWVPQTSGQGDDPRQLGFFLNAVELDSH